MRALFLCLTLFCTMVFAEENSLSELIYETLYADSEPDSILFQPATRGFRANEMVSVFLADSTHFRIDNFTPAAIGLTSVRSVVGDDTIALYTFDSIPPFTRIYGPICWRPVRDSLDTLPPLESSLILTSDDTVFAKLQKITMPWAISFVLHDGGRWGRVTPFDARRYCAGVANLAWLFSDSLFRNGYLRDSSYILLNNRTNHAGDSVNPVINRDLFNERISHHKSITLGKIVSGVAGLGVWYSEDDPTFEGAFRSHSFMGIRYFDFYNLNSEYTVRIFAHEFGHIMGFTHESTISVDDTKDPNHTGFAFMVGNCYRELLRLRKLPFPDNPFLDH